MIPVRGEIHWANLEPVQGSEQGGSRPVLIISNTIMNERSPLVKVIPITRNKRTGIFNPEFKVSCVEPDEEGIKKLREAGHKFLFEDGSILCSHARTISKDRLHGRIGKVIDENVIKQCEGSIKADFALDGCRKCGVPLRPNGLVCGRCGMVYRIRCLCGSVVCIEYNYCPSCGRGMKNGDSK